MTNHYENLTNNVDKFWILLIPIAKEEIIKALWDIDLSGGGQIFPFKFLLLYEIRLSGVLIFFTILNFLFA